MSYQLGPISISGSVVTITGSIATTQTSETTASWANRAITASYALTSAGSGNAFPFTGNASISGSLTITGSTTPLQVYNGSTPILVVSASLATIGIGTTTLGDEANLYLGAKNTNEGGQIGFAAGTNYTTSSFIDNYQDKARILKGPNNTTSNALVAQWDLATLQYSMPSYTSATSYTGTPTANLAVDSGGNVITTQLQGYTLFMQSLGFNPTDAVTYYMSTMPRIPTSTDGTFYVTIPKTGAIKSVEVFTFAGTAGTGEAWPWYVRVNSVDTLIATLSLATQSRNFINQSMNVAVTTGDQLQIKTVCPTWATNPLTLVVGVTIYIE